MAEPNPQPDQEEAPPQPVKVKGGGVMGPIVAAIIIVAGIAGIMKIMVLPVLEDKKTSVSPELSGDGVDGKQANDKGSQESSTIERSITFDLGEPILVNIEGNSGKVLSAKVGYLLKTGDLKEEDVKLLKTAVEEFKPLLRDGVRGYLTSIQEDELELVTVHKEQLRRRMNDEFDTIRNRSREPKIKEFINSNPVERVLLPSFTAQ
jgi:flagellar basal body-associated protein FliL